MKKQVNQLTFKKESVLELNNSELLKVNGGTGTGGSRSTVNGSSSPTSTYYETL